jgi:hypothetical protein
MRSPPFSFICDSLSLVNPGSIEPDWSHNDWGYMKDDIKIGNERDGRSWKIGGSGR